MTDVILENAVFRLTVGDDCIVKSLLLKENGEECLKADEEIALFSVTQDRPFNNEVKLAHPNKRTVYQANDLVLDGKKLIVGFEIIPCHAVVEINEQPDYVSFRLADFVIKPGDYGGIRITPPPVVEFRLIQLPVRNRESFGEWLNVSFDDKAAVNVLATSPYAKIDSERRRDYRVMYADARKSIKLLGCEAALIVSRKDELLDCIDVMERDFGLPLGVESRRAPTINRSAYWTSTCTPETVDKHIAYAKQAGFKMMLIYYPAIFKSYGYSLLGNYEYRDEYPEGAASLKKMVERIKEAGITPGMHVLQTHIGLKSKYVTPVADHRLNLTRHFTLAKPLCENCETVYVEENPEGSTMCDGVRVLKFAGELITYDGYTTEYPYKFTGCKRGAYATNVVTHPLGEIGGILDVSEFGATSTYLDQNSSLQDEVADRIAEAFNTGFRFMYFDGSEGANVPYEFHVPNAQYRVYKKLAPAPLYTEGAAKAHFSWHFLSGGNAFDIFPPEIFKAMIDKFPAEEAPRMRCDFTRLNFGWWGFWDKRTQPDMFEYGTSRAAAWDCPVTLMENTSAFAAHARTPDCLEVMRRWEDVRANGWLTEERKQTLRSLGTEHILLINEKKEYELAEYKQIECTDENLRAFAFTRCGESWVVYWHPTASGKVSIDLDPAAITVCDELYAEPLAISAEDGKAVLPADGRRYVKSSLPLDKLTEAFKNAAVK